MLLDFRDCEKQPGLLHSDILVIGAGTVGLLMAADLAKRGLIVTVLEAGPTSLNGESQKFFETARNIGLNLEGLHLGRFRALGGTSNFWGGQLVRFDPLVFGEREWVSSNVAWPIAYQDVAPYYEKAFEALGMQRVERTDAEVVKRLKLDVPYLPSQLEFMFTRWTPETNTANVFEEAIRSSPALRVVTNAQVVALTSENDGNRVSGAEVVSLSHEKLRFTADTIVLANGTIEIARLLKLPLADGRPSPWANNSWIGRGFMDHVDCIAGDIRPLNKKRFHLLFDNVVLNGLKYQPKLKLSERGQIEHRLLGIASHFVFKSSITDNLSNAKIFFKALLKGRFNNGVSGLPREILNLATIGVPMVLRYLRYNRMYNPADLGIQLRLTAEQLPVRESGLRLGKDVDSFGIPIVEMNWKVDGREIETLATFAEMVSDYLETSGLARVEIAPQLKARDPAFMNSIDDANHHIGMARMSNDAADGVVNRDLRVHGTENLYVAGAAVFPSSGFANPTFTAMALGLRLADSIGKGVA